jgi:transposase
VEKLLTMSTQELSRLEVMQRVREKRLTQKEAGEMLGLSVRQVKRLLRKFRQGGASELVSKRRGRPGHNQLSEEVKQKTVELLHGKYRNFGPTLACEKLVEVEGLKISDESVRQLMIGEGLWKARKATVIKVKRLL